VNPTASTLEGLSARIVDDQLRARGGADAADALAAVFHELRRSVSPMIGELGYTAVLKRAIWLASRNGGGGRFPAEAVPDAALLREMVENGGTAHAREWSEAVLARLFSLLRSFIGEPLTLRLVARAFPQVPQEG
jgi:hypothetical protein